MNDKKHLKVSSSYKFRIIISLLYMFYGLWCSLLFVFSNYEKYFMQSLKVRRLISDDFKNLWKSNYDFLVTPTTLTTAPLLSEFKSLDNRTQCATQDYCTQPANMTGKCRIIECFSILKNFDIGYTIFNTNLTF